MLRLLVQKSAAVECLLCSRLHLDRRGFSSERLGDLSIGRVAVRNQFLDLTANARLVCVRCDDLTNQVATGIHKDLAHVVFRALEPRVFFVALKRSLPLLLRNDAGHVFYAKNTVLLRDIGFLSSVLAGVLELSHDAPRLAKPNRVFVADLRSSEMPIISFSDVERLRDAAIERLVAGERHRRRGGGGITALAAEPRKVVRIVDGALGDLAGAPTEARITGGTEHLIAALDLTDRYAALGATLGLFCEQGSGRDLSRIARVLDVLFGSLEVVAVGAGPARAQTALPGRAQKALAVGRWTGFDKGRRGRADMVDPIGGPCSSSCALCGCPCRLYRHSRASIRISNAQRAVMKTILPVESQCKPVNLLLERGHFFRGCFDDLIGLAKGRSVLLGARQSRLFTIAEGLLSVRLVRHETEGARHFLVEKVALPALRAVGLGAARYVANVVLEIGLETGSAERKLAIGAFGGEPCGFVGVVATESTGVGHRCRYVYPTSGGFNFGGLSLKSEPWIECGIFLELLVCY
jgi:hypothetical protein